MTLEDYAWLSQGNEVLEFAQGDTILEQGNTLNSLYYVQEGVIRVDIPTEEISSILFRGRSLDSRLSVLLGIQFSF